MEKRRCFRFDAGEFLSRTRTTRRRQNNRRRNRAHDRHDVAGAELVRTSGAREQTRDPEGGSREAGEADQRHRRRHAEPRRTEARFGETLRHFLACLRRNDAGREQTDGQVALVHRIEQDEQPSGRRVRSGAGALAHRTRSTPEAGRDLAAYRRNDEQIQNRKRTGDIRVRTDLPRPRRTGGSREMDRLGAVESVF